MKAILKNRLFSVTAGMLCAMGAAQAQTPGPSAADTVSPHSLTGNVALVSDYRFRGVSQSYRQPAIQGGFDYTHASGFYLGNWNSSVSSNAYNNGASLEVDLYAARLAFLGKYSRFENLAPGNYQFEDE